ncbi:MAG TPA: hypothetical protein VEC36_07030 [Patescibacteria group bacterium]|nr:hypothetical protein [Patescibacteria group bacterium]
MFEFSPLIFLHALYVGLTYALMAFGAAYYRQVLDNLETKKIRLGEDLFTFSDPAANAFIIVLCGLFCIFAFIALTREPKTLLYVIPIAFAINVIQLIYRTQRQRGRVKTEGIHIRYMLFKSGGAAMRYEELVCVEIKHEAYWYSITFFTNETEPKAHCRMSQKAMNAFVKVLKTRSDCSVIFESKPQS